jgi:hypothetical protein
MNYFKNSIVFCTAFKDINRKDWSFLARTNEQYLDYFLDLAKNIEYKLIVYVEKNIYDILKKYHLTSNIELRLSNEVKTFYDEYIENETKMMQSEEFKKKIPEERKGVPELTHPAYTLINHSKVNYIRCTKSLYPYYEYYSWIDFGCIRSRIEDVPCLIDFNKLNNKISYLALNTPYNQFLSPPENPISAEDMVGRHDVYLAGSQCVVHNSLVEIFENKYRELLEEWKSKIICDEDQGAVLQLYFKNKDLFQLFHSNEWFSLFRNHLNSNIKINNKNDIHRVINCCVLGGIYAEIGVCEGTFTEYILRNTLFSKLLLIDPYINFEKDDYVDGINKCDMEQYLNNCKNKIQSYRNNIEFIRKTSSEAVKEIPDNSLDVLYIDGNHEYRYVIEDLINYWPKVRPGGIVFGDDLYEYSENDKNVLKIWDGQPINESNSYGLYGVHNAVVDFCKEKNIKYHIFSNQFYIYKF